MSIVIGWIVFAMLVGVAANSRGRGGFSFFLLSLVLSPLIGILFLDRTPRPFEPDGVLAGVPYRVADDGSILAVMQGATVRFQDFEKFTGALGTNT
jgi:hypothetical protein